jgi:hypothetical protein
MQASYFLFLVQLSAVVLAQDYDHYVGRRVMTIKWDSRSQLPRRTQTVTPNQGRTWLFGAAALQQQVSYPSPI